MSKFTVFVLVRFIDELSDENEELKATIRKTHLPKPEGGLHYCKRLPCPIQDKDYIHISRIIPPDNN